MEHGTWRENPTAHLTKILPRIDTKRGCGLVGQDVNVKLTLSMNNDGVPNRQQDTNNAHLL